MLLPAKNRMRVDALALYNAVPVRLRWHRQPYRGLRDAWPQGHVGTTGVIVLTPFVQETPQVMRGDRDHEVQAFPTQRAQEALTQGIGLGGLRTGVLRTLSPK